MQHEKLLGVMGRWAIHLKDYIESSEFDSILKELGSRKGTRIRTAPESSDMFRAFSTVPPEKLRVLLVGICPYHTFKNDKPVADGLCLSCSKTGMLQPSLENLYSALEDEYNNGELDPDMDKDPNLQYLCDQGVMLYNVAQTVCENMVCSDNMLWSGFNKAFWECINREHRGIPIILMGQESWKSEQYIDPLRHYIFKISHPAGAAYNNTVYSTDGTFRKVDKILMDNNGDGILWYKKKEWKEKRIIWEELAKDKTPSGKRTIDKEWEEACKMPWDC